MFVHVRSTKISIINFMQISFYIEIECSTSFHSEAHVSNKWSESIGTENWLWRTEWHMKVTNHLKYAFTNICSTVNICDLVSDYSKETVATE